MHRSMKGRLTSSALKSEHCRRPSSGNKVDCGSLRCCSISSSWMKNLENGGLLLPTSHMSPDASALVKWFSLKLKSMLTLCRGCPPPCANMVEIQIQTGVSML